jgi:hypothetical protein
MPNLIQLPNLFVVKRFLYGQLNSKSYDIEVGELVYIWFEDQERNNKNPSHFHIPYFGLDIKVFVFSSGITYNSFYMGNDKFTKFFKLIK